MTRPRLLDLFCGAGGAAVGYVRAGFEVIGVDIEPQPRYPFEIIRADALEFPLDGFDAVHASPPCQPYSRAMKHLSKHQPMLIDSMRARLAGVTLWVIESVMGAPLPSQSTIDGRHGVMLCGGSFGLRVARHRLFEASIPLPSPGHRHPDSPMNPHNQAGRDRMYAEFGRQDPEPIWLREMGVGWMSRYEGREAIPPAYTEWIGQRLLEAMASERAA